MLKTNEELLKQFKKANKLAKLRLAQRAGFKTTEDYLNDLQNAVLGKKARVNVGKITTSIAKPTVHIVNIVDASTSMAGSKISAANEAVQSDINMVKSGGDVNYTYTLISFSNSR